MDEEYMQMALDLALKGRGFTSPNPMVGAVIVKNGHIIGTGCHERWGEGHAEVNALNSVRESPEGATMYVTLEPCSHHGKTPPCADRIIKEKIARVVIAMADPNPLVSGRGIGRLRASGIEVKLGVLKKKSERLNEVFIKYIIKKEPFVHLKTAMSLDGKIATWTGDSKWISCEESRREVHQLRAYYSGIMVGVQTVIADNPELTCRNVQGLNPVRIIADSTLRIPLESKVLTGQDKAKTIVATTKKAPEDKLKEIIAKGVQVITTREYNGHVCLTELIKELGGKNIDSVLLEGGATLNYSALEEKIVDKVSFYLAPMLIGGVKSPSAVGGEGVKKIGSAISLTDLEVHKVGVDIKVEGYVEEAE